MLKQELKNLHKKFLEETYVTNEMIEKSIKGLLQRKEKLLNEVIENDEPRVNEMEVDIDKTCIKLIALYQPTARDLREIMMIFKISDDLERMADHAVNIADSAKYLIKVPEIKPLVDIPKMAEITQNMLTDCIHSFVERNSDLAYDVCKRDDAVDELRDQILRELIEIMRKESSSVQSAMHLIRISKNLERIADLTTNIAEDVVYIETGKLIKHKSL